MKSLFLLLSFCLTSISYAERWNIDDGGILSKGTGAVISGYDTVSYFTESNAVKGKPTISVTHDGGVFLFSTEQNRKLFLEQPHKYLPEYGGFCAYAAASNSLVDIDPTAFTIIDGRLYLNYSKTIKGKFDKESSRYISEADKFWPSLKN